MIAPSQNLAKVESAVESKQCGVHSSMVKMGFFLALTFLGFLDEAQSSVILGREISRESGCEERNCATIYICSSTGEESALQGTHVKIKQKDVSSVRVVGLGCFKIFKSRRFKGSNTIVGSSGVYVLKEQGHSWTSIR